MRESLEIGGRRLVAALFCFIVFTAANAFAADGEELHGEAAGGHEAGSSGLPQLDASTFPSQLFWLAITFAVLYIFFSQKALPEISGVLENRRNHIDSDLDTAEQLKAEAETAQHLYEESLGEARETAAQTMADLHAKLHAVEAEQTKAFLAKTEHEIRALEARLKKARGDVMEEMNTIAAEVAKEAAEKIVGIPTDIRQAKTVVQALNKKEAA